jgi:F0F1-type ATP synthase membrane subunit b/b'
MTMPDESTPTTDIPTLTDIIEQDATPETIPTVLPTDMEALIAELQTELSADAFALTEKLLRSAISEMEATLFEKVLNRLRQDLPELVDTILREHLGPEIDED